MPVTTLEIGGQIPQDLLNELAQQASLDGYYHTDAERFIGDYDGYFNECASACKPIILKRIDPVFVGNKTPEMRQIHEFLGEKEIHFRDFRPPSEGVDGQILIWSDANGYVSCPATVAGEPLLTADEIQYMLDCKLMEEEEIPRHQLEWLQNLRESPPAAKIVVPALKP